MRVRGTRRAVAAVLAVAAIGLAGTACSQGSGRASAAVEASAPERAQALSALPAAVDGPRIVVGQPKAPHTVTVFVDPRCSYCAKFEEAAGTVLADEAASGKVRVEYVIASFLDARTGGTASARAANALRAAAEAGPGKFATYQAALFASRPSESSKDAYSPDHLLEIADQVPGLRGAAFDEAVRENTYEEWVGAAEKAFEDAGVGGTPTVLVDGEPLPAGNGLYDAHRFSEALRDAGV
ncbi:MULTISPECIES: thioredoxin domain-containing protein [unclassified Streptomyces]|uniref:DsbA family protein n=1 Tax=unclassified Streptomyces TaxID=2593676 RepID=UPI002E34AC75|nr:thioredoxin domain-containing protein [Streptomyces sp. NBC_01268]